MVEENKETKEQKQEKQAEEIKEKTTGKFRQQAEETSWEDEWIPKTQLGRDVKSGKIKSIDEIFKSTRKILEPEIVDKLLDMKTDLLLTGQAKGKFGGGKRRAWKQTQKKTEVGNIPKFSVLAVAGDEQGYIGTGRGEAKETFPAREKGIRKAKLNIIKIKRGCGSFDCSCNEEHSIPFSVEGKCSSVRVKLMPASQGTGLVASDELKRILRLAGIKDVYSKTYGKTKSTINLAKACMQALNKLSRVK